jgi:hypothetical protein
METLTEVENRYTCPKALWRKMSERRKVVYNNIRGIKQHMILPPKMKVSLEEYEVIAHNFAYMAACEVE